MSFLSHVFQNDDSLYEKAVQLANQGLFIDAADVAMQMKDSEYQEILWHKIADITSRNAVELARKGQYNAADDTLHRAGFAAERGGRSSWPYVISAHREIAKLYENAGYLEKALETLRHARVEAISMSNSASDAMYIASIVRIFSSIAEKQIKIGNIEEAFPIIDDAILTAMRINDEVFHDGEIMDILNTLLTISMDYAKVRNFERAGEVINWVVDVSSELRNANDQYLISAEMKKLQSTYEFIAFSTREEELERFENALNHLKKAATFALEIENKQIFSSALLEVVKQGVRLSKKQLLLGRHEMAKSILEEAANAAIKITDDQKRSIAFNEVKNVQISLNN